MRFPKNLPCLLLFSDVFATAFCGVECEEIAETTGGPSECDLSSPGTSLLQSAAKSWQSKAFIALADREKDRLSLAGSTTTTQKESVPKAQDASVPKAQDAPLPKTQDVEALKKSAATGFELWDGLKQTVYSTYNSTAFHSDVHSLVTQSSNMCAALRTHSALGLSIIAILLVFLVCMLKCMEYSRSRNRAQEGAQPERHPTADGAKRIAHQASRLLSKYGDEANATGVVAFSDVQSAGEPRGASPRGASPIFSPVTTSRITASFSSGDTICPGLLVPESSTCVLVVRALRRVQVGTEAMEMNILAPNGTSVLLASIFLPWPERGKPVVALRSLEARRFPESGWLTACRAGSFSESSVQIYDKDDILFGSLKKDMTKPRYVLTGNDGQLRLVFGGSFRDHTVSVLDGKRNMVAHTNPRIMNFEPHGSFYEVHITAGIDVGLVISGLLSVDAMEACR